MTERDSMLSWDRERAERYYDQLMQAYHLGVSSKTESLPSWEREGLRKLENGETLSVGDVGILAEAGKGLDNTLGSPPNQPLHPDGKCEPGIPEDELINIMRRFNGAMEKSWPETQKRIESRRRKLRGLE